MLPCSGISSIESRNIVLAPEQEVEVRPVFELFMTDNEAKQRACKLQLHNAAVRPACAEATAA